MCIVLFRKEFTLPKETAFIGLLVCSFKYIVSYCRLNRTFWYTHISTIMKSFISSHQGVRNLGLEDGSAWKMLAVESLDPHVKARCGGVCLKAQKS